MLLDLRYEAPGGDKEAAACHNANIHSTQKHCQYVIIIQYSGQAKSSVSIRTRSNRVYVKQDSENSGQSLLIWIHIAAATYMIPNYLFLVCSNISCKISLTDFMHIMNQQMLFILS